LVLVEREFIKILVGLAHLHFLDHLSLMVVVAVVDMRQILQVVDLEVELDKDQQDLKQDLIQIQTQIPQDRDILVVMLVIIQVVDGLVLVVEEVLVALVLMEMLMVQDPQILMLLVAVVELVFRYHQLSKIQLLE
tara:strand:- start:264 stop:668 length:405 start_codon:yes stop_codon:yes gene_type:complete